MPSPALLSSHLRRGNLAAPRSTEDRESPPSCLGLFNSTDAALSRVPFYSALGLCCPTPICSETSDVFGFVVDTVTIGFDCRFNVRDDRSTPHIFSPEVLPILYSSFILIGGAAPETVDQGQRAARVERSNIPPDSVPNPLYIYVDACVHLPLSRSHDDPLTPCAAEELPEAQGAEEVRCLSPRVVSSSHQSLTLSFHRLLQHWFRSWSRLC